MVFGSHHLSSIDRVEEESEDQEDGTSPKRAPRQNDENNFDTPSNQLLAQESESYNEELEKVVELKREAEEYGDEDEDEFE